LGYHGEAASLQQFTRGRPEEGVVVDVSTRCGGNEIATVPWPVALNAATLSRAAPPGVPVV
jgi:hypothetical protein